MQRRDLVIAPLCEAALLFVAAAIGWAIHKPMIFASLGPTAYELVETPERKTARPYNVMMGHFVGILAAFAGLYATHAYSAPAISTGIVTLTRIGAGVIAAGLTVFVTLLIKAAQPAAVATALMIALGSLQTFHDALVIMSAVLLVVFLGEPIRQWRLRAMARASQ